MDIEFDAAKDQTNRIKHGISLAASAEIDLGLAIIIEDCRFDYGEARYIAYAPLDGKLHALWYTFRGGAIRVIGLRTVDRRERARYEDRS